MELHSQPIEFYNVIYDRLFRYLDFKLQGIEWVVESERYLPDLGGWIEEQGCIFLT